MELSSRGEVLSLTDSKLLIWGMQDVTKRTSLVSTPRIRREKWPGIHCLRMRERFWKFSANKSEYGQVTLGCYAEK